MVEKQAATTRNWMGIALIFALGLIVFAMCALPKQALAETFTKELSSGEEYIHTFSYEDDDRDIFTISAPKGGYVYFELTVLSENDDIDYEVWTNYAQYLGNGDHVSWGDGVISTGELCVPEGQKIELKVDPGYACKPTYRVKAITATPDNFEIEPNNTRGTASKLPLDEIARGVSNQNQSEYDEDHFVYPVETGGYYTLKAHLTKGDSVDVSTYIGEKLYMDGVRVASDDGWVDCGTVALNPGQRFYADVQSTYGNFSDLYELKLTFKPFEKSDSNKNSSASDSSKASTAIAPPRGVSLKSVKAQSKAFIAKWSTGKSISGYRVRYSTSKSMSGAKYRVVSSSKVKLTVKKLKSKSHYYVQVQTYKKHSNPDRTYYSSWSNMKSVKVK